MTKLFALLALVPTAIGPLPQPEDALTIALCSGRSMTIPLGDKQNQPKPDCHSKACHAGSCREKSKRSKAP